MKILSVHYRNTEGQSASSFLSHSLIAKCELYRRSIVFYFSHGGKTSD